jgi:hypothetical protein
MFTTIIFYVIVGVAFNYLWDLIISKFRAEENRFTMLERLVVVVIWPVAIGFFLFILIRNLFFNNDQE